ncbi:MAG: cytochrome c3 family protein [bacterium]|nr:cytochrome c3 family protein [bacterium]MDT8364891.1 cytochrome c3 family protein [bacterium]
MARVAVIGVAVLSCVSNSGAAPLGGTVHDLSASPAYIASGGSGLCGQCHTSHGSCELTLWCRDLTPDAVSPGDLCLDCHDGTPPSWALNARDVGRFNGSLHDFSGETVAPRGACSACHDLHLPDPGTLGFEGVVIPVTSLWTRDLTEEFNDLFQKRDLGQSASVRPDYLIGTTALCFDCHSGNHIDSFPDTVFDFDNNPQDIAFGGDRQSAPGGVVGYYEVPDGREPDGPLDATDFFKVTGSPDIYVPGGHYVMTSMDSGTEIDNYQVRTPTGRFLYEISIGDKIPCQLCHDPHMGEINSASDDEAFFAREVYAGEDKVATNNDSYFTGKVFKTSAVSRAGQAVGEDDGTGREMCLWCHGSSDWDESTLSFSVGINPLIVTAGDPVLTIYGIKVRTALHPDGSPSFPPPNTIWSHRSDSTQPCTDCHGHNNVQLPGEGCLACHSAPKVSERETPAEDLPLGINATDFDSDGHGNPAWGLQQGRECVYCHLTTADQHPSNPLDVANNPYRLRTYGPGSPGSQVCLVCHSSAGAGISVDSSASPLSTANSSVNMDTAHWGLRHTGADGGGWCWDCHNPHGNGSFTDNAKLIWQYPSAASSITTGQLITPTGSAVIFTPLTGKGTDYAPVDAYTGVCQVCHNDPALMWHVVSDTSKNGHMNTPAGGTRCTVCHWHRGAFAPSDCNGCHDSGLAGAPVVLASSSHVDADGPTGSGYVAGVCVDCHGGHADGVTGVNDVEISTVLASGQLIPVFDTGGGFSSHGNAIQLGGTATVRFGAATEAQMCWGCHDTVGVSEWGLPTMDTNGTFPDYDSGSVDVTDWTAATWTSAEYLYKGGPIQSTHAADFAASGPGVDAVGSIRCSYCHDVHNTKAGSPAVSPYLRGTWMGNPYPEDGAPRFDAGGDQHIYPDVSGTFGAVPRGSTANTQPGGYFIDQNSGSPTSNPSFNSADKVAGLCEPCHGDGDGLWSADEINTLNTFGNAASDWVGSNGHAAAVTGGDGTGAANVFDDGLRLGTTGYKLSTAVGVPGGAPAMAYQNFLLGTNDRALGFRGAQGHAFKTQLYVDTAMNFPYVFRHFSWGTTAGAGVVDYPYHRFTCSKCHSPHASRLKRLMITNCLDTNHNTWDDPRAGIDSLPFTGTETNRAGENISPENSGVTWGNSTSAQNCHRLSNYDNAFGEGWNRVTPWAEFPGNQ